MPTFRHQTNFEISRGVKAFLGLVIGVTRGKVPEIHPPKDGPHKPAHARTDSGSVPRSEDAVPGRKLGQINPQNIVWILGSPRTGSTWLGEILGEPRGHALWKEPFFGVVLGFRNNLANRGFVDSGQFVLGEPHRDVWVRSMRNLFLDVGQAKFPNITPRNYLAVKEPNGSLSAPLIMEAFPESKLVFLVRDPRDVVASLLDAAKKGSWYDYDRYEASVADALRSGGLASSGRRSEDEFVEQLARNYVTNISAVREAYEKHSEDARILVRYEDLRANPLEWAARICETLGLEASREQLEQAVRKRSWENIPEDSRGEGKFHRKATPGAWREDLTPRQAEIVEKTTAPLLEEFYPG
jgi:LPS sulfotransferase NodH